MSRPKCDACESLREDAPNLIVNGLGDTECTSLANNTGLNPSSGNDDCEDLHNLNDCLVGGLEPEIDAYDVCEWKEFTRNFVNNTWTVLKGVICAICGLWANLTDLSSKISELCTLITAAISPTGRVYGIFPRNSQVTSAGQIVNVNGRPALIDANESSHNADLYTGVGFRFGTINSFDCNSGQERKRIFWKPYIWGYKLNKDVQIGDALWVITKSQFQSLTGTGNAWWQLYIDESWVWTEHRIISGADRGKSVWLKWHVGDAGYSNDYLVLTYDGTSYPNAVPNYDALIHEGDVEEVRWGTL